MGGGGGGGGRGRTSLNDNTQVGAVGGKGGGGDGTSLSTDSGGDAGKANTGGGGGGGGGDDVGGAWLGGNGGSGIVIVRWKLPSSSVSKLRVSTTSRVTLNSGNNGSRLAANRFKFYKWVIHDTRDPLMADEPLASGFQIVDSSTAMNINPIAGEFRDDHDTRGGGNASSQRRQEVTFEFAEAHILSGYRWRTHPEENPSHDPRRWTLLGSGDKEAPLHKWQVIHRVRDHMATRTRGQWQTTFTIKEVGALDHIRDIDPLDVDKAPAVAYSTRRLFGSYTGPLLRIRRASDEEEADVWIDAIGRVTYIEKSDLIDLQDWLNGSFGRVAV